MAPKVAARSFAAMWSRIPAWAAQNPLALLTAIALLPRLVAAFFSGGFFAYDDHFLVIEPAGSWADGFDYDYWLPWNQQGDPRPLGRNLFYPGLHWLLFVGLKAIGIGDPKALMVVVRVLHALWSVLVVRAGYRIALRLGDDLTAWRTGLLLALLCHMPFLAVRNLVETAAMPALMMGAWWLVRREGGPSARDAVIAGLWLGLAMNIRYQTLFFAAGPGIALLLQRRWKPAIAYGAAALGALALVQGGIDLAIWGRPFAEFQAYVAYNAANTETYGTWPWYNHLLLLALIAVPPLSLAVFFGFLRSPRPLTLWLGVALFVAIHSYFPNKQERFILPIVPLFVVLGFSAWERWRSASPWWNARPGLWRGILTFSAGVNLLVLLPLTVNTSKRSQVEALYMLREQPPVKGIVIEDTHGAEPPWPPVFYLGKWDATIVPWGDPADDLATELARYEPYRRPEIVLFFGVEDLETRMARLEAQVGPLHVIGRAEPGLVDRVVHWLNPVNRNETIVVARIANAE